MVAGSQLGWTREVATQEPGVKIELAAEGCECARPSFCAALTLGARSEMKAKRPMRGKCWLGKGRPWPRLDVQK